LVGDIYPCQGDDVVCPAEGVWSGLKSDEGDAEEMKDEWEISVDPSTGRDFSFDGFRLGIEL
jgi:hypothetical protein